MRTTVASGVSRHFRTSVCAAAALATFCPATRADEPRARLRELGITIGRYSPGPLDSITDVKGVLVGQTTIVRGEGKLVPGHGPIRTGVTAIVPHGGDLWREKVPAGVFVMNGNGEVTGTHWLNEAGALEVPILLTNTMNVGRVSDAAAAWMIRKYPDLGIGDDVVLPVVGECDDSFLNDAQARAVGEADVFSALDSAKGGLVEEGTVGAGTGMVAFEFKGGIGTASRLLPKEDGGFTVGALVNANFGARGDLRVDGVPVGRMITDQMPSERGDGSIIIVVATDAPLDSRQCQRIARRAIVGLAHTGSTVRHTSGDFAIAFSTAYRIPHYPKELFYTVTLLSDGHITPLFEATEDAVEEAILNALCMARTTVGRDGNTAHAIPLDRLRSLVLSKRP